MRNVRGSLVMDELDVRVVDRRLLVLDLDGEVELARRTPHEGGDSQAPYCRGVRMLAS